MAVDLGDYTDTLVRAITPLGGDEPDVQPDTLIGYLTDAFWEARLDGFFPNYTADADGVITPISGDLDLDRRWISLIILYASTKVLGQQILNTQSSFRAKAGPVEFETQNSATTLAEMLKQLAATKQRLLDDLRETGSTSVMVIDALSVRSLSAVSYFGGPSLTGGLY